MTRLNLLIELARVSYPDQDREVDYEKHPSPLLRLRARPCGDFEN